MPSGNSWNMERSRVSRVAAGSWFTQGFKSDSLSGLTVFSLQSDFLLVSFLKQLVFELSQSQFVN